MASFLTPTAEYGQFAKQYYAGLDAAQQARLKEEEAQRAARDQALREQVTAENIRLGKSQEGRAAAQENRQAAAFAEQQRRDAALRATLNQQIPAEPTMLVPQTSAAGTLPGLRTQVAPAAPTTVPTERPAGIRYLGGPQPTETPLPSFVSPNMMRAGLGDVTPPETSTLSKLFPSTGAMYSSYMQDVQRGTSGMPYTTAIPYVLGRAVQQTPGAIGAVLSDIAQPITIPAGAFLQGLTGPSAPATTTPAQDEVEERARAAQAGVALPAQSAATTIASTPSNQPVANPDAGNRLYALEIAQVARARKELQAQRKEVVRYIEQARAAQDLTAFNNARLTLMKIDNQIEDKNRVDALIRFRDSKGTKTLEPLAQMLNEVTYGRVEIEPLADGTFNLYDNATDPNTPFTTKPLKRDELWYQLDLAFNDDRIAKEQAAIAAQTEARATYTSEFSKAAAKELAAAQVRQQYPQANYKVAKDSEGQDVVVPEDPRFPAFRFVTVEDTDFRGRPKLDATGRPMTRVDVQEIPLPNVRAGSSIIPGWQGPTSTRGIPIQD